MAHTACLFCFISTVNCRSIKKENALKDVALVVGTQQNLSNLYSLDIIIKRVSWFKSSLLLRIQSDSFTNINS
jgi:hypothetical protein